MSTKIIGPFMEPDWSYASVDGFRVPYIKLLPGKEKNEGRLEVHLDGRMVFIFDDPGQVEIMLPLLAHAMAVAAGYSCFGENSIKDPNPFKVSLIGISSTNGSSGYLDARQCKACGQKLEDYEDICPACLSLNGRE